MPPKSTKRIEWIPQLGISIFILALWLAPACTFDKGEVIAPDPDPCDTSAVCCDSTVMSYAANNVDSIIILNCMPGCHTGSFPAAGPNLNSYDLVKVVALSGDLMCSINWGGNCTQMPFGAGTKIDSLEIATIQQWISEGMCP
ncbi:MAG: hypothetical protein JKY18_04595 [Flavobacteriales bacterium]|nr:hypothetical protein [Flavobacteriales bacterium]